MYLFSLLSVYKETPDPLPFEAWGIELLPGKGIASYWFKFLESGGNEQDPVLLKYSRNGAGCNIFECSSGR